MPPLSRGFGTIEVSAVAWPLLNAISALGGEKKMLT